MTRHRTLIRLSAALAGVALVWACGGDSPTAPPTPEPARPATVTVSPATADLTALGATVQLTAEVRDQNARVMAGATVTWSSADTSVATVDASGLVTAVGNGTATITASAGSASGSTVVTVTQSVATVSGTVNHGWGGWADPQTNGFGDGVSYRPGSNSAGESGVGTAAPAVTTPDGYVIGAVVEIVDGPDAGRQATTDDSGHYVLEGLQQARFTIQATAEGFASVSGVVDLTVDRVLDLSISHVPPTRQPPSAFPDTDPAWLRTLAADYPHAHQVANVRVFSDISPTFSREHAEYLKQVWDFFNALYVRNRGDWIDVYYTSDPEVFQKVVPHCPTIFIPGARNLTSCYLDYPHWFILPDQIPDFGTQLHEIGHDFFAATWPYQDDTRWFIEGTAMYFEGGVFAANGSLRVSPHPYCTVLFHRYDQEALLIPLAQLLRLREAAFLADNERAYSQSCMLFNYLEAHEPGVLYALIYRINSGQIISNDQLITSLLELTGKTVSELEEAYQSYARGR